ncbi:hypothetical protein [Glycomyces sp. NPDC047010]|uniref:hypothetical protein n=1 Tax=Glycomyces sp. NPDC047010 TaxID=3155023 RepID=UPI0033F0B35B
MTKFESPESLIELDPPSHADIRGAVRDLQGILTKRYMYYRYADYAFGIYGDGALTAENYHEILGFMSCLTADEATEFHKWCSDAADVWIDEVLSWTSQILTKSEDSLSNLAKHLRTIARQMETGALESRADDVLSSFDHYWKDAAGDAARENYGECIGEAVGHHTDMAFALANGAESERILSVAARAHIDEVIKTASAALEHGSGGSDAEMVIIKSIANKLTDTGVGKAFWTAVTIADGLSKLDASQAAQTYPVMSDKNPDTLKQEVRGAFDSVEEVLTGDREVFGQSLTTVFNEYRNLYREEEQNKIVPGIGGVGGRLDI